MNTRPNKDDTTSPDGPATHDDSRRRVLEPKPLDQPVDFERLCRDAVTDFPKVLSHLAK